MKSVKSFVLFFAVIAIAAACKNNASDSANQAIAPAATNVEDQFMNSTPAEAAIPVGPLTSVTFAESEHDFGTVMDGEKITHIFQFTNTGKEPLVISKAEGSCGCTVPDWPREPIAPGKGGEIKVVYDSRGKGAPKSDGGRMESKRVTITANTDPVNTYLTIKGTVVKPDEPAS